MWEKMNMQWKLSYRKKNTATKTALKMRLTKIEQGMWMEIKEIRWKYVPYNYICVYAAIYKHRHIRDICRELPVLARQEFFPFLLFFGVKTPREGS